MTPEMLRIISKSITIPGRKWRFHPAVPVGLMARNQEGAQRKSPLALLKKKTEGEFDPDVAGVLRIVPNGNRFHVVIGATRAEYALEAHDPKFTMPAEVYPEPMSTKEQAVGFLAELVSNPPGTATKHRIGVVSEGPSYLAVEDARLRLEENLSVGALTEIEKLYGPETLRKTVDVAVRTFPKFKSTIPGVVLRGLGEVVNKGGIVRPRWRKLDPARLQDAARTRQSRCGGKGTVYQHVAALLVGKTSQV